MKEPRFSLEETSELEKRRGSLERFLLAVIDPEEWPYFISDAATVFDISSEDARELADRINKGYRKTVPPADLRMPLWRLLDLLAEPSV